MDDMDISMEDEEWTAPGTHEIERPIGWLSLDDPQKNQAAVKSLCRMGHPATARLIAEADKPGRSAQHRLALLGIIQRIGGPLGQAEFRSLRSLLRHPNPGVREKAEQIIRSASPRGLPDSPGSDLMQAYGLLFQPPRCPPRRSRLADFNAMLRGDPGALRRRVRSGAAQQEREERKQGRRS